MVCVQLIVSFQIVFTHHFFHSVLIHASMQNFILIEVRRLT